MGKDVFVFVMVIGNFVKLFGMNFEGMWRCGFLKELIWVLCEVYKIVYMCG